MEDARVEILGSINYPGIATNITSKFNDKCKLYESFEEQEDHLEIALETWLRQACLPNAESENSNLFLKYWGKLFDKHCLLYTSPSPRDGLLSRMPSSA